MSNTSDPKKHKRVRGDEKLKNQDIRSAERLNTSRIKRVAKWIALVIGAIFVAFCVGIFIFEACLNPGLRDAVVEKIVENLTGIIMCVLVIVGLRNK